MAKTLGGSTFVYNALKQDYNIIETLECLYALCDEVSVCYGGTDGTVDLIRQWFKSKFWGKKILRITEFEEDDWQAQKGREKLSYFSNLAIDQLRTDWNFYLQADEILHEASFPFVRKAIEMDVAAHLVTRHNLWFDPYHMLNVEQNRKPCSSEVIRLAKVQYRCVDDAESLGVPMCVDNFLKDIRIYHLGFVRDSTKHLEKIRHIQDEVFLIDHDKRIDGMEKFDPYAFFSLEDVVPITEELPIFIQQWAKERFFDQLLTRLQKADIEGEFSISKDCIEWYYELDSYDPETEEPHDALWDAHCEAGKLIDEIIGDLCERTDSWADNDSCGVTIVMKKL